LLKQTRLSKKQIDALVWPKDAIEREFVTYRQLRPRLGIVSTRENLDIALRLDQFPRGYLFNEQVMWRVRDIENFIINRRRSRASCSTA
jgi:hypothetical protein